MADTPKPLSAPTPPPVGPVSTDDISRARAALGGIAAATPASKESTPTDPTTTREGAAMPTGPKENTLVERAYASHAMEGSEHRRASELEELVGKSTAEGSAHHDVSILLAKQRQLAEASMEGEERRRAREAEEATARAIAQAAARERAEAERLARLKEQEEEELVHIATIARTKQHQTLATQQATVDELVKTSVQSIRPVRTLKADMDSAIKGSNLSMVGIAIKEDERRRADASTAAVTTKKNHWFATVSTVLVLGGVSILGYIGYAYFFAGTSAEEQTTRTGYESLVFAEKTKIVSVRDLSDTQLAAILKNEVRNLNAPIGSVEDVHLVQADDRPQAVSFQEFVRLLRLDTPDTLVRNLGTNFMFGVYSAAENGGFMLLEPQNFERAFAGLLAWEPNMLSDLGIILSGVTPEAELLRAPFTDVLIKNISGRAVYDKSGKIILLYSFFDKNNLIIAANETVFVEVISRLTTPRPVLQR